MKKSLLIWGVLLILLISLTGCGTPSNTNQASQENINKIAEQNETILNQQKELKENMLTNTNLLLQQLTQADADEMYVSFANELVSILTEDEKYVIDTGTVLSYKEKDGGFVYEIQFASEKKELKVTIDGLSIYMCEARNDSHTSYYKLTDKNGSTYYDRIVGAKVIAIADLNNTLKMLVEVHQE